MLRAWIATVAMLMCLVASISIAAQQPPRRAVQHPRLFAPEDNNLGFENAAPPSDVVLDALLGTQEAKDASDDLEILDRESERKLFATVRINLRSAKEEDYIALGDGPLSGADHHWFWIVRASQGKAEVLLFTGGLAVEILPRRTNGYHDVKESWGGNSGFGSRLYQYTGTTYKLAKERWQDAKP